MLNLVINKKDQEVEEHFFEKDVVILGEGTSDINLPEENLSEEHVKFFKQGKNFYVENTTNDPFITLNDMPFGKRRLKNGDLLKLGNTIIEAILKDRIDNPVKETPPIKEEPSEENLDIEDLLNQVEELETEVPQKEPEEKEYIFDEFDDENEQWNLEKEPPSELPIHQKKTNWKLFLGLGVFALAIFGFITVNTYFRMTDHTDEQLKQVSRGMADVSMALTYAQNKHLRPRKHSWSSPDFIKKNLTAVLSSKYQPIAQIEAHGQFSDTPYFFRIYTSSDLTRFLVIAQPAPSLVQWFVPHSAIVVDSTAMELRKIQDLKALNRLLANPNSLDDENGQEISKLVKEGEIIPLSSLSTADKRRGFTPPKALFFIRPGAENLIYNAPRYYSFGESLIQEALTLTEIPASSEDVTMLRQDVDSFSTYPDMVLYSSQGMQIAMKAQKALSTFVPHGHFIFAYLKFNNNGVVTSSHLLIEDTEDKTPSIFEKPVVPEETYKAATMTPKSRGYQNKIIDIVEKPIISTNKNVDINHPLYLRLTALVNTRLHTLKPYSDEIISLLNQENQKGVSNFQQRFHHSIDKYESALREQNIEMQRALSQLYQEYANMPFAEMISYVKEVGLEIFLQENQRIHVHELGRGILPETDINNEISKIQVAKDFKELEATVYHTSNLLTPEKITDTDQLINYQNLMKAQVLSKLGQFLLSPYWEVHPSTYEPEDRDRLINILRNSWISDPDEFDFYLNEFDYNTNF